MNLETSNIDSNVCFATRRIENLTRGKGQPMTKRIRDKHYTAKLRIQNRELKARNVPIIHVTTSDLHWYEVKHQVSPECFNMFTEKHIDKYAQESVIDKMHDLLARNVIKDEEIPGRYSLEIWVRD